MYLFRSPSLSVVVTITPLVAETDLQTNKKSQNHTTLDVCVCARSHNMNVQQNVPSNKLYGRSRSRTQHDTRARHLTLKKKKNKKKKNTSLFKNHYYYYRAIFSPKAKGPQDVNNKLFFYFSMHMIPGTHKTSIKIF